MRQDHRFVELRRSFRRFVIPMAFGFLAWYLLYVLLSTYARDFMGHRVLGDINVAMIFGLLQFVTTFLIARWYARFAAARLDPVAARLRAELEARDVESEAVR
ncbi:MAG: DUF485 domain-containing protein [Nocardiopsaceae bacterium]|nr:DUF485 domain-containing protein [Nocardiopsaceae bacterium]